MIINELNNSEDIKKLAQLRSLSSNSVYIYNTYLNIPSELPQRVKDLAVSITANETNNFDRAKAIEKYLSANYGYTLTPEIPAWQGFCGLLPFWTKGRLLCVFCLCHGNPCTQYRASGPLCWRVCSSVRSKDGVYEVTNKQAHAWPEIYFEGFGWVSFEPTPVYQQNSFYSSGSFRPNMSGMLPQTNGTGLQNQTMMKATSPTWLPNLSKTKIRLSISFWLRPDTCRFGFFCVDYRGINKIRKKHWLKSILNMSPKEAVIKLYETYLNHLLYQYMPVRPRKPSWICKEARRLWIFCSQEVYWCCIHIRKSEIQSKRGDRGRQGKCFGILQTHSFKNTKLHGTPKVFLPGAYTWKDIR